jgi:hypothetical protein
MTDTAPISLTDRLASLRASERHCRGADLIRVRRQIAMLTEDLRKPMVMPAQKRRVG